MYTYIRGPKIITNRKATIELLMVYQENINEVYFL